MNRKILQAGPATLAISLPMSFVKKFELKKGQELLVEEQGSVLKVSTKNIVEEESAVINVNEFNTIPTKLIGMLYKTGYKKIKAIYDPSVLIHHRGKEMKEIDMIKNTFAHLTGMQIWDVNNKNNEYYATCVQKAQIDANEFDNTFNQLYFHLINQAERIVGCFSGNNEILNEAYLVETLINQTADFCVRILISAGYKEYKKTPIYYGFANKLESLGDKYFHILMHFEETKEKFNSETQTLLKENLRLLRESASQNRKFDSQKMMTFIKDIEKLIKNYEGTINNNKWRYGKLYSYDAYMILMDISEIIEIIYSLNYTYFQE